MKTPWFSYTHVKPVTNKKAVVIGGGIAGCQMAWHLCELGWEIILIERHDSLACEASGNIAGVISPKMTAKPSAGESFYIKAFHYTLSQLNTLTISSEKGLDWHPCGVLQLAHNERELKRWESLQQRDFDPSFLQTLEKDETEKVAGIHTHHNASWFPTAGWISPKSFCNALTKQQKCTVLKHTTALTLQQNNNNWQIKDENQNIILNSQIVIIANGKDIQQFDQSAFLPGEPILGQTTSAKASHYSSQLKTVLGHEGYLTPSDSSMNNSHICGATFERITNKKDQVFKATLKEDSNEKNLEQLKQYLPEFANSLLTIESSHAAYRFTTPDRYPYVGALPDQSFFDKNYNDLHQGRHWQRYPTAQYQQGLYVFGGFGSRGLTTSGLCAKLLSQLIDNKLETMSQNEAKIFNAIHPARFIIKEKKRGKLSDK